MPQVAGRALNPAAFKLEMSQLARELPADLMGAVKQRIMLETLSRVVKRTPVDTGRARGNWQVSDGDPITTPIDNQDRGGGRTIALGSAAIANVQPFGRAFITNNLPYIGVLEFGGYPRPGLGKLGFISRDVNRRARSYRFVRSKDGTRRRVRISERQRYRNAAAGEGQSKVTADGFSRQAPRGMVRITLAEMDTIVAQVLEQVTRPGGPIQQ